VKLESAVARKPSTDLDAARAVYALAALAQETRLAIFRLLIEHAPDGLTPGAIASALELAPATLSFHLKELTHAGLVTDHRNGRFIWYRADLSAMTDLLAYLTEHCCRATRDGRCEPVCAPARCAPTTTRTRKSK
jgi:DNA-binding transcriptional ArsR family regulator